MAEAHRRIARLVVLVKRRNGAPPRIPRRIRNVAERVNDAPGHALRCEQVRVSLLNTSRVYTAARDLSRAETNGRCKQDSPVPFIYLDTLQTPRYCLASARRGLTFRD